MLRKATEGGGGVPPLRPFVYVWAAVAAAYIVLWVIVLWWHAYDLLNWANPAFLAGAGILYFWDEYDKKRRS